MFTNKVICGEKGRRIGKELGKDDDGLRQQLVGWEGDVRWVLRVGQDSGDHGVYWCKSENSSPG